MENHDRLLVLLSRFHIGKGKGISAKEISAQLGLIDKDNRAVRTLISYLRENGIAICGTPKDGYYIAATPEELKDTCDFLRGRAMHSLKLEANLRRIPLPDLLGQLHLPT